MKIRIFKATLLAIVLLAGCSESLLNKVNPNGGTPEAYYSTLDELTKGVTAIYAVAQSNSLVSREWFFVHDLRSDDVTTGGGQLETPRFQILVGSHNSANPVMTSVWQGFFELIHRANSVITGSENATTIAAADKNRFVAEARFLRAWAYSDLVLLWGGVPLYTEPVKTLDGAKKRSSVDEINTFLIDELKAIQADLPVSYPKTDVGRATKGAAQLLLARVYMSVANYTDAKTQLDAIVSSNTYTLMDNYVDNFKEETPFNNESIFEIGFSNTSVNWTSDGDIPTTGGVNEGNTRTQEYSAVGWRNLIPSDGILAEFESAFNGSSKDDPRFENTFVRIGDMITSTPYALADGQVQGNKSSFEGGTEKISWRKYTAIYKTDATFYTGPMNMRIMRYAEVLLNLAECENELGNGATAIGYLNQIRDRASVMMPNYPTVSYPCTSKAEIFSAVQHERRVEFAGEQIRNRDILRWRKNGKLTAEPISYFQANKYEFLPIPAAELSTNANISQDSQNPGY